MKLLSTILPCAVTCCLILLPACTSPATNGVQETGTGLAETDTAVVESTAPELNGLALTRLASELAPDIYTIKPRYDGAGFSPDFPVQHVITDGECAVLTPGTDPAAGSAANAAWCVYPLRCYHEAESATLSFTWEGAIPFSELTWVGLTNWETGTWDWQHLPEAGYLAIDPLTFSTAEHIGVAVVATLNAAAVSLREISLACDPDGTEPFVLYCPQQDMHTYLINRKGQIVKDWNDDLYAAASIYLTEDLEVLKTTNTGTAPIQATGSGGGIELWDFDGNVLWSVDLGAMGLSPHHDIERLPNGNILVICWDLVTEAQAIAAGRDPATITANGFYVDSVIEIAPTGAEGAEVVWEWHFYDHLVQEYDAEKNNYGVIAENPGSLNINFTDSGVTDLTHANAVDYNAELDQVMISLRSTSEFYIIDHSTTTAEAAGHTGGRYGMGGDILYRWGNPAMWNNGTEADQILFGQHDVEWIPEGCPGAGHLLMFNNGTLFGENRYSRILEIVPPLNGDGSYYMTDGGYGPETWEWRYTYDPPEDMFSWAVSGSQRLPDGNTLICVGLTGWFLEVDPEGTLVWQFHNRKPQASMSSVFRADAYYLFNPWLKLTEIEE